MLYDLGSVCTDVQVNAEFVTEAELEVGDAGAGVVFFVDVEVPFWVGPGASLVVEVAAEADGREHATVIPPEVVHVV